MRYVDRGTVRIPASLATPAAVVKAEMDAAVVFYQTYVPGAAGSKAFVFEEYKAFDVQSTLRALFKNKCAYCEGELLGDVDVEHFRPKGAVTDDPNHPGYWWLAHSWDNLLASCEHCNQSRRQHLITEEITEADFLKLQSTQAKVAYGKLNQFPIDGARATYSAQDLNAERAHLINPTEEDPDPFFMWSAKGHYSIVLAKPDYQPDRTRALSNISVFALNRLRLVQSRTSRLNELRYHKDKILRALEKDALDPEADYLRDALREIEGLRHLQGDEKPYSAMVAAFFDELKAELLAHAASTT